MEQVWLVNRQAPVTALAARERLIVQHQQSLFSTSFFQSSFRFQGWPSDAKTVPFGPSSSTPIIRLGICCASQRTGAAASDSEKESVKQKIKGNRADLIEQDIYTIDDGWKVDFAATEEMREVAGIQIPVKLKQRLYSQSDLRRVKDKAPAEPPRTTHKLLRVMAGTSAGKKLTSPADAKVRPMMEVVRGAVFNILNSLGGWMPSSPSGRWLDLYSGTGSVAIEALSRGCCVEAHFVEMDPWVISNVLQPNLEETNFQNQSKVHTSKVETLLQQASDRGAKFLGGAFDYISVTPPYEAVSYTELMTQLSKSPLLADNTFMVVEYPIKSKHEMPDSCGALIKIKDRRYGRTHLAIYGPRWLDRYDEVRGRG